MHRKRRSDRNHIIYLLTSPTGKTYVGITVMEGKARIDSLNRRWMAHCRNANTYNRDNLLSQCIREEGHENFKREIIEVVRGKDAAHLREMQIVHSRKPSLNMIGMGF